MKISNVVFFIFSVLIISILFTSFFLKPVKLLLGFKPINVSIDNIRKADIDEFDLIKVQGKYQFQYTLEVEEGLFTRYLYPFMSLNSENLIYVYSSVIPSSFMDIHADDEVVVGVVKAMPKGYFGMIANVELPSSSEEASQIIQNKEDVGRDPELKRSLFNKCLVLAESKSRFEHIGWSYIFLNVVLMSIFIYLAVINLIPIIKNLSKK